MILNLKYKIKCTVFNRILVKDIFFSVDKEILLEYDTEVFYNNYHLIGTGHINAYLNNEIEIYAIDNSVNTSDLIVKSFDISTEIQDVEIFFANADNSSEFTLEPNIYVYIPQVIEFLETPILKGELIAPTSIKWSFVIPEIYNESVSFVIYNHKKEKISDLAVGLNYYIESDLENFTNYTRFLSIYDANKSSELSLPITITTSTIDEIDEYLDIVPYKKDWYNEKDFEDDNKKRLDAFKSGIGYKDDLKIIGLTNDLKESQLKVRYKMFGNKKQIRFDNALAEVLVHVKGVYTESVTDPYGVFVEYKEHFKYKSIFPSFKLNNGDYFSTSLGYEIFNFIDIPEMEAFSRTEFYYEDSDTNSHELTIYDIVFEIKEDKEVDVEEIIILYKYLDLEIEITDFKISTNANGLSLFKRLTEIANERDDFREHMEEFCHFKYTDDTETEIYSMKIKSDYSVYTFFRKLFIDYKKKVYDSDYQLDPNNELFWESDEIVSHNVIIKNKNMSFDIYNTISLDPDLKFNEVITSLYIKFYIDDHNYEFQNNLYELSIFFETDEIIKTIKDLPFAVREVLNSMTPILNDGFYYLNNLEYYKFNNFKLNLNRVISKYQKLIVVFEIKYLKNDLEYISYAANEYLFDGSSYAVMDISIKEILEIKNGKPFEETDSITNIEVTNFTGNDSEFEIKGNSDDDLNNYIVLTTPSVPIEYTYDNLITLTNGQYELPFDFELLDNTQVILKIDDIILTHLSSDTLVFNYFSYGNSNRVYKLQHINIDISKLVVKINDEILPDTEFFIFNNNIIFNDKYYEEDLINIEYMINNSYIIKDNIIYANTYIINNLELYLELEKLPGNEILELSLNPLYTTITEGYIYIDNIDNSIQNIGLEINSTTIKSSIQEVTFGRFIATDELGNKMQNVKVFFDVSLGTIELIETEYTNQFGNIPFKYIPPVLEVGEVVEDIIIITHPDVKKIKEVKMYVKY